MKSVEDVLAEINVSDSDYGAAFEALLVTDKKDTDTLNDELLKVN